MGPRGGGLATCIDRELAKKVLQAPYVGVRGWVGIELSEIEDEELTSYLLEAWRLIAPKKL
jgi:hypothetical protein